MRFAACVVLIFCMAFSGLFAAEKDDGLLAGHNVGAVVGYTMGFGPAYRYWPGAFGAQVSFSPIITNDVSIISVGAAGFYSLIETESVRYFLYSATSYYYYRNATSDEKEESYALGLGPGVEILLFKRRIALDFMFGYGGHYETDGYYQITFTGECGFFFRF